MRIWRRGPLSVLALTLLAGCASDGAGTIADPDTAPVPEAAPAVAVIPAEPTIPEVDAPAPSEMLGWSTSQVTETLGAATLVRNERGAEIWQYRTDACVLFLFFYHDGTATTVKHIDTDNGVAAPPCVTAVVRQYVTGKTG